MAKEPYQGQVLHNPGEAVFASQFAVEGNDTSAYEGVDPVYQTYANDTERPLAASEPAEVNEANEDDEEDEEDLTPTPPSLP
jgi:hypothetical protein